MSSGSQQEGVVKRRDVGDSAGVLERGAHGEKRSRTWETHRDPARKRKQERRPYKENLLKSWWESDRCIVLRDGRADHMGKAATESRSSQRKHDADKKG